MCMDTPAPIDVRVHNCVVAARASECPHTLCLAARARARTHTCGRTMCRWHACVGGAAHTAAGAHMAVYSDPFECRGARLTPAHGRTAQHARRVSCALARRLHRIAQPSHRSPVQWHAGAAHECRLCASPRPVPRRPAATTHHGCRRGEVVPPRRGMPSSCQTNGGSVKR